ncbi:RNA-binding domain-containing protein [uncultured Kordia sp.]|uniref:RNA-binding domain-containing protein n=1 Tax=uncultured Kordia sp. TaxID=507699 RepID=UPI002635520E|nr:RNA-binding domain-containing protein [uncultured Kordia sp.]
MSNVLLLIDDKETFKETFKITAQRKGYQLAWGKSYDELVEKLEKFHEHICTVVLDVKCLMSNDQPIEHENFIGSALIHLSTNYAHIPRVVLTGDETALAKVKDIFSTSNEDIYSKSVEDIERMFTKIEEHKTNFPIRQYGKAQLRVLDVIKKGEGKRIEFKSTLRFDIKGNEKADWLIFETFKNIAAFLNSEGGTILIGVADDREILGLEAYDYSLLKEGDKQDLFQLQLDNLIRTHFGDAVHRILSVAIVKIEGKSICEIRIKEKYTAPIFITKKEENKPKRKAFYIRRLSSAIELKDDEMEVYIKAHWS